MKSPDRPQYTLETTPSVISTALSHSKPDALWVPKAIAIMVEGELQTHLFWVDPRDIPNQRSYENAIKCPQVMAVGEWVDHPDLKRLWVHTSWKQCASFLGYEPFGTTLSTKDRVRQSVDYAVREMEKAERRGRTDNLLVLARMLRAATMAERHRTDTIRRLYAK